MRITEAGGPPVNRLAQTKVVEEIQQWAVARQHAVVELFERSVVVFKEGAEATQLIRALDQHDVIAGLSQFQGCGES